MYDTGTGVRAIRRYLIKSGAEQRSAEHEWSPVIIYAILRAEDYTGIATWNFSDGTSISIEIPAIIDRDLWFDGTVQKDNKQTQWLAQSTYSGKIVENLTQAVARDVLAWNMLGIHKAKYIT